MQKQNQPNPVVEVEVNPVPNGAEVVAGFPKMLPPAAGWLNENPPPAGAAFVPKPLVAV